MEILISVLEILQTSEILKSPGIKCQASLKGYYNILKYIEIPRGKCILSIKKKVQIKQGNGPQWGRELVPQQPDKT